MTRPLLPLHVVFLYKRSEKAGAHTVQPARPVRSAFFGWNRSLAGRFSPLALKLFLAPLETA